MAEPSPTAVRPGVCLLHGPQEITLWADSATAPVLRIGGEVSELRWEGSKNDWRIRVTVTAASESLNLELDDRDTPWELLFEEAAQQPGEGEARLQLARSLYKADSRDSALAAAMEAERILEKEGRPVEALRAKLLQATLLREDDRLDDATAKLLIDEKELVDGHFESRSWLALERAVQARARGDLRGANGELELQGGLVRKLTLDGDLPLDGGAGRRASHELLLQAGHYELAHERRLEDLCAIASSGDVTVATLRLKALSDLVWTALSVGEAGVPSRAELICPGSRISPLADEPALKDIDQLGDAVALVAVQQWVFDQASELSSKVRGGELRNLKVNLALAHLQAGSLDDARRLADDLASDPDHKSEYALWVGLIQARVAARQAPKSAAARQKLAELARKARESKDAKGELHALRWLAQVHLDAGEHADALRVATEATQKADELSALVPVLLGGGAFASVLDPVNRVAVEAALGLGDEDLAWSLVRESRVRYLRALQLGRRVEGLSEADRASWTKILVEFGGIQTERAKLSSELVSDAQRKTLDAEALALREVAFKLLDGPSDAAANGERSSLSRASPEQGQLWLGYYRAASGWIGFALDAKGLQVQRLGELRIPGAEEPPSPELASSLFEPFKASIAAAGEIALLPTGALRGVDLHALPFDDQALAIGRPVSYRLDLPPSGAPHGDRLWMVADAEGNLQHAGLELIEVREQLPRLESLTRDQATRGKLLSVLEEARVLFYASHASFDGDGWSSRLTLADGNVEISDILVSPAVPRTVVLMACESAANVSGAGESLGIAQAFLLAGSQEVIAASRDLKDELGRTFSVAYARRLAAEEEGAVAWHHALQEVRDRLPGEDWASLRRITR